jgi:acyl-ACP thioesterase
VDDATIALMKLEPKLEMNYKDRRIILPKAGGEGEKCDSIKVMHADIDYNQHMNNANYIRMAMELLPEDFVIKDLRVEYRVAAKLGDVLIPTVFEIENGYIIELAIGSEASAIVEFTSK